jgi:hypothetical protein
MLKYNMSLYTRRPRVRENAESPNAIDSRENSSFEYVWNAELTFSDPAIHSATAFQL